METMEATRKKQTVLPDCDSNGTDSGYDAGTDGSPHKSGFTLLELLTVIGILALLAALLFPIFSQVRAKGRQTACASNLRQLGIALAAYMQDNDETSPNGAIAATIFASHKTFPMNSGWAGRIFPYVKNAELFRCPGDPTGADAVHNAYPVSYGINQNMALAPHVSSWTAPAHTVLFFEVQNNTARILLRDEGTSQGIAYPGTTSAAGNGLAGLWDLGTNMPPDNAPNKGWITFFATGLIDNHETDVDDAYQFPLKSARHGEGANYLATDGHAVWQRGGKVSAGHNAQEVNATQNRTGCKSNGGVGGFPCAEGTEVGKHTLTFSIK